MERKRLTTRMAITLLFLMPPLPANVSLLSRPLVCATLTWLLDKITKLLGKVVQAYNPKHREYVAVKVVRSVQKYRDAARLELRVLQTLRENDEQNKFRCIHLRDCFDFHGHICIVTDLLASSLFDFLKSNSFVPFPNSHIQSFAKQLLTSVACTCLVYFHFSPCLC